MEGEVELINLERVEELKGELAEACKTTEEKAEVEENRLLSEGVADDKQPEVKLEMVERKAEEIIPKECWGLVFRNLDVEDLLICRQVCKTFNQLLDSHEFKMKWKFKVVLPLLLPYLETRTPKGGPSWKHLSNARLTCKSWRHWIDKYVREMPERKSLFPKSFHIPLITHFGTSEDIQEFQKTFGECNENPFPSRSVFIGIPDMLEFEEEDGDLIDEFFHTYFENVGQLLEQFGKHIFRLRLHFENALPYPYPSILCELIKTITIHLPNLKALCLCRLDGFEFDVDEEDQQMAAAYIAENPIEASPELRALSFVGLDLDKKLVDYLLEAFGPQLIQLETTFSKNHQMQQLRNLQKLWLLVDDPNDNLESLGFLQSPLEYLNLNCIFESAWNVDKVLRNLRHLPIELLEISIWQDPRLNLAETGLDIEEYENASIKTLILQIHHQSTTTVDCQISFNFLQALTKLENLQFKFTGRQIRTTHPGEVVEVVKLNEYLGEEGTNRMYDSNVWEKVPSLKTITRGVNKPIFTRKEYVRIRMIAEVDDPERN